MRDLPQGAVGTRTNSYDDVPYDNLAFAQTHPDRLATAARIFGLQPPPIATCRVLELGCASGGNLIPMAFNLPDATFVGVDLSRRQIERGLETVAALGIGNLTLTHASILDVTREWGEFDYIVCHGVFSWVESHVQDAILRIAKENLSPNGVAYISYNTYPGWHMREMIRDMMRYHTRQFDEPQEQIEQARALLAFLVSSSDGSGPYGELLTQEVERLSHTSDSYLFHEHLEQTNTPIYFHQFIERAERAGLMYLSEALIGDMLSSQFQQPVAETLERISPDIVHLEQYMDFVRNRQFRQTLLCHARQQPKRALTASVLHGLLAACRASCAPRGIDLTPGTPVSFEHEGRRTEVNAPATKAAIATLMEAWPRAIPVDVLCESTLACVDICTTVESRRTLMVDLFQCFVSGLLELHTYQPDRASGLAFPRVNALAAHQAHNGSVVVNPRHETIRVDDLTRTVLQMADGTRTREEILEDLVRRAEIGGLTVAEGEQLVTGRERLRSVLSGMLGNALIGLDRADLLVSSPAN